MKVILLNGSPKPKGCTFTGLSVLADELEAQGIETEIIHIGNRPVSGCIACNRCSETGVCAIDDGRVMEFLDKVKAADGVVFGTPVHFAGMSGAMKSFLDRAFYTNSDVFRGKPAAIMASVRRGGSTATLDGLIKYPSYGEMLIVSGRYWNMIHGNTPEQVMQDEEGIQNLRFVGKNMAWILKLIEAGAQAGITLPEREEKYWTNFIR